MRRPPCTLYPAKYPLLKWLPDLQTSEYVGRSLASFVTKFDIQIMKSFIYMGLNYQMEEFLLASYQPSHFLGGKKVGTAGTRLGVSSMYT